MLWPGECASAASAAAVLVPDKVPVLGFVLIATVMFPVNPVAMLPLPSWAVTSTAGVIAAPAVAVLGCTRSEERRVGNDGRVQGALGVSQAPVAVVRDSV